uniref:Uncharacterized protein n=1 Tax=Anopheles minimus TaxID=112268 RepID=A0A182WMY4_9DIPT
MAHTFPPNKQMLPQMRLKRRDSRVRRSEAGALEGKYRNRGKQE